MCHSFFVFLDVWSSLSWLSFPLVFITLYLCCLELLFLPVLSLIIAPVSLSVCCSMLTQCLFSLLSMKVSPVFSSAVFLVSCASLAVWTNTVFLDCSHHLPVFATFCWLKMTKWPPFTHVLTSDGQMKRSEALLLSNTIVLKMVKYSKVHQDTAICWLKQCNATKLTTTKCKSANMLTPNLLCVYFSV